jgi:hypothetical protein
MTEIWAQAALWLGLALVATLISIHLRMATALSEIVVGTVAQLLIGALVGGVVLSADASWIKFLSGAGAIVLTFLAGAELDPVVFRRKWKEATAVGLVSFAAPFFGCAAVAYWGLGWTVQASWLAGIAMSTTSVAVVYAVMLEFGFNVTDYGKTVLAACFITDLATVLALGFIFSPFTVKTLVFFRTGDEIPAAMPVRHGGARRLGGQRSGAARLHHRHGAGGHGGKGSCVGAALAHADLRPVDAVLFHPCGCAGFCTRADRRSHGFSCPDAGENGDQDRRCLSRHQALWFAQTGSDVHHAADVHRPDLRHDFRAVRFVPSCDRSGAVFLSGGNGDRQCSGADADRQCFLSTAPLVAQRI